MVVATMLEGAINTKTLNELAVSKCTGEFTERKLQILYSFKYINISINIYIFKY